jgi:DUF4097 and DUF4098 domain-containing protein YvlB
MNRQRRMEVWLGAILSAVSALILFSGAAYGSDEKKLREEFHQVYPLTALGRVGLENINGAVHITGWNQNEVKVDAVKTAWSKKQLDEARIEVDAQPDSVSIRTHYPDHNQTFTDDHHDNPASVEYTISVPRQARLDQVNLVNGDLDVQGLIGEVHASCVNGRLDVHNLHCRAQLSTVNGQLDAVIDRLATAPLELSAVNGGLRITLPSDAKARVEATTVSGGISDDFGLHVSRQMVGQSLRGELGGGGTDIKLSNVNGHIEIRHANDNRPMSPAKNLEPDHRDRDNDRDDNDEDDSI